MLIEFSVKNYCSIRDKQTLSMVASNKDKSLLGNLIEVDTPGMGKTKLLTSAVVYGANASGKSNLFAAARFMRLFVTDCVTKLKPGDKTGVRPFRLDPESEKSPSEFEVMFLHEGVRYQYGFALDETRVHEEWLFAYPKGKSQRWFQRTFNPETEEYDWAFSTRHLKGDKESLKGMTRDNALFLSVGAQFNHEQLGSVSIWFPERLIVLDYAAPRMVSLATQLTIGQNEKFGRSISSIADLLKNADTGIEDLKAERDDNGEWKLQFLHKVADSRETVAFEEWEESTGTRKFLSLLGPWFGLLRFGSTQFIDEIDASMHPLLVRELLRPIHDPDSAGQWALPTRSGLVSGERSRWSDRPLSPVGLQDTGKGGVAEGVFGGALRCDSIHGGTFF